MDIFEILLQYLFTFQSVVLFASLFSLFYSKPID